MAVKNCQIRLNDRLADHAVIIDYLKKKGDRSGIERDVFVKAMLEYIRLNPLDQNIYGSESIPNPVPASSLDIPLTVPQTVTIERKEPEPSYPTATSFEDGRKVLEEIQKDESFKPVNLSSFVS